MNRLELLKQLFEKWWTETQKANVEQAFMAGADAQDALEADWNDPERDVVPDAIVQRTVTFDITEELAEMLDKLPDNTGAAAAFDFVNNHNLSLGTDWYLE